MLKAVRIFKLLTDELRIRILMILDKKELSVCQIMGVTGASQPLISRNLSILYSGGFLDERRDGKLRFYRIRKDLSDDKKAVIDLLRRLVKSEQAYKEDLRTLRECDEFQKRAGRCDMKTLQEFIQWRKSKHHKSA